MTERPDHHTEHPARPIPSSGTRRSRVRVRVSFALRCEILVVSVGIAALALCVLGLRPSGLIAAVLALAVVAPLLELLAWAFGPQLRSRAPRHWYVDLDQRSRDRMRAFLDDTEDNPTIR